MISRKIIVLHVDYHISIIFPEKSIREQHYHLLDHVSLEFITSRKCFFTVGTLEAFRSMKRPNVFSNQGIFREFLKM